MREEWEIKNLNEIAQYSIGLTYSPKDVATEEGIIVLRSSNIQEGIIDLKDIVRVNKKIKENLFVRQGDILMCSRNGSKRLVGKVATIPKLSEQMTFGTFMTIIRSPYNAYLSYFFNSDDFREQIGGGENPMINQVTKYMLDAVKLNVPPLPEQQRIVSILDEAFAAIAKAKANYEQNLKNAKELFESYLEIVFTKKGEGWETKVFEDVCKLIGGSQPSKDEFVYSPTEGYIRLVQVRDYKTDKYATYIPLSTAKRFCSANDIMIGRYGPPIFGIFKGIEGSYNVALMKAEVKTDICDHEYFYWFLKTKRLREFVEHSSKRAAGQDGVRKELLDKYPVYLPSLAVQRASVKKFLKIYTQATQLELTYTKKIQDLDELKKALLQKAFSGELTAKEVAEHV